MFATLPPLTVGIWARHLAYGAALGVAPGAVQPIPMGVESDTRAWTASGGRWRAVRIDYPVFLPLGWGLSPWTALVRGVLRAVVFGWLLYLLARIPNAPLELPLLAIAAFVLLRGVLLAVRALADLVRSPVVVEGELLRLRAFGDRGKRYYAAVDEAGSERVRAFVITPSLYARLEQGELVVATVTPHLRHVHRIERKAV